MRNVTLDDGVHDIISFQLLINHAKEINLDMDEYESNFWDIHKGSRREEFTKSLVKLNHFF